MIYDDYLAYTDKYKALYGEKTLVLMEVGSFFEAYSVEDHEKQIYEGANTSEICGMLNIQASRKSKAIHECSRTNPNMFGFPNHVLQKFLNILLQHNYTVVLVEQTTPPPNPTRAVTQIISPATYTEAANEPSSTDNSRFLMCLYFGAGYDRHKREPYVCITASMADITTGDTSVLEDGAHGDHERVIQDADRIVTSYKPREIVVVCDPDVVDADKRRVREWIRTLHACVHDRTAVSAAEMRPFQTPAYQNATICRVYPDTGLLSPIEHVDLASRWYALICYVYLIDFLYQHSELLVKRLRKPTLVSATRHMLLANNAVEHLNILPKAGATAGAGAGSCAGPNSVMQLLNTCATAMGRRLFRQHLLTPLLDPAQMEARYALTEAFKPHYAAFAPCLRRVQDLERLFRRLAVRILQPCEMATILTSLAAVKDASALAAYHSLRLPMWGPSHDAELDQLLSTCKGAWDFSAMESATTTNGANFYRLGAKPAIDALALTVSKKRAYFEDVVARANAVMKTTSDFKLDTTAEREDYTITITKRRYEAYLASPAAASAKAEAYLASKADAPAFDAKPVSASNKTLLRLTFDGQAELQTELHAATAALKSAVREEFARDLEAFDAAHGPLLERVVEFISGLDVVVTNAKNAVKHNYARPAIVRNSNSNSCIRAKALRHPLIEAIQEDVPYVPNDVALDNSGLLVFGINASGKSSLMKAVGLNLILAQAGMHVAADEFAFAPYDHVFTRIPGGDNLFKAQSTFVAEMCELRTILNRSTARSLVIGDELACGSESVSAISIVAAGVITLANKGASFIFATHLHEVAELEAVKALKNLAVYHMRVTYDDDRGLLIYDRRLQPGVGDTLYGLEVCKSLDLPLDFMHLANTIRKAHLRMSPHLVNHKPSRYSSKVFVDVCSVCAKPAEEVHHIKEQQYADARGFVGGARKNSPHNLMAVCQACHDAIHAKKTVVEGYAATSQGVRLLVRE